MKRRFESFFKYYDTSVQKLVFLLYLTPKNKRQEINLEGFSVCVFRRLILGFKYTFTRRRPRSDGFGFHNRKMFRDDLLLTDSPSRKPFPPKNFGGYGRGYVRLRRFIVGFITDSFKQKVGMYIALLCLIHDQLFNTCEARWRKVILQLLSCFTHRIMNHGHAAHLSKAEIL